MLPPPQVPFRGSVAVEAGLLTRGRLRGRDWRRLLPDVYIHHDTPVDHRIWCAAVALILPPGAAIGGLSAAYLWGAGLSRTRAQVSIVTPRDQRIRPHQRIAPHYTILGPDDLTLLDSLPVTTAERTAFDLGRRLRRADALASVDALLRTGHVDLGRVAALARERSRWPRTAQLSEVLRLADPRSESPMETRMRLLFHDAGLPPPRPQLEVRDRDGRLVGRVDLGWETSRVAAEYEGDHHRGVDQCRQDVARVSALQLAGWTVLRFTADDILRRPRRSTALVATALARSR
ncbi:DUF559 domain-containing protein [Actinoplanes sp. NPDC023714]|uniref:DUF559 domain-containing protein n=1 Tax=Actinoplanes sp. NPDC023714 TaxID=3154322 RepID=UPI0033ED5B31